MTHEFSIPLSHPRAASLKVREKLLDAWRNGIVADAGLMAHGRGEAFDYILGERTIPPAQRAIEAAACRLLVSRVPVVSVNGNSAALSAPDLVELAQVTGAKLEVNLFYRSQERASKIAELLRACGASKILGVDEGSISTLPDLESERRRVDSEGIMKADTVLVPLEDGDRTLALRKLGKIVISVDLNPLSRTARTASITIVDNITRAVPALIAASHKYSSLPATQLHALAEDFDNQENLKEAISFIGRRLDGLCRKGLSLEVV